MLIVWNGNLPLFSISFLHLTLENARFVGKIKLNWQHWASWAENGRVVGALRSRVRHMAYTWCSFRGSLWLVSVGVQSVSSPVSHRVSLAVVGQSINCWQAKSNSIALALEKSLWKVLKANKCARKIVRKCPNKKIKEIIKTNEEKLKSQK